MKAFILTKRLTKFTLFKLHKELSQKAKIDNNGHNDKTLYMVILNS